MSVSYREYNADCKPFLMPFLEQRGSDTRELTRNFSIPGLMPGHGNSICHPPIPSSGVCLYLGVPTQWERTRSTPAFNRSRQFVFVLKMRQTLHYGRWTVRYSPGNPSPPSHYTKHITRCEAGYSSLFFLRKKQLNLGMMLTVFTSRRFCEAKELYRQRIQCNNEYLHTPTTGSFLIEVSWRVSHTNPYDHTR